MTIFITRNSYFLGREKFHLLLVIFLLEYLMKIPTFEYGEIPPISGDFYDENFPT
jgi:hypothetical protein